MSIVNVAGWTIIVGSVVMIVLHSAVVFVLKKQGILAAKRTYRSERMVGTVAWLLLAVLTLFIVTMPMNDTFRGSAMLILVVILGWVGGLMFVDDVSLMRRTERQRMSELQSRIQRQKITS